MNRRIAAAAAAGTVIAGTTAAIAPQHAFSAARVLAAAVAVVTGTLVLLAVAPVVRREVRPTDLDRRAGTGAPALDPHGLRDARRDLGRPAAAGAVPPAVWDRLVVAAALRLQGIGVDVETERGRAAIGEILSPSTAALLGAAPGRGSERDPQRVSSVVHRTLDELEQLARPTGGPHGRR